MGCEWEKGTRWPPPAAVCAVEVRARGLLRAHRATSMMPTRAAWQRALSAGTHAHAVGKAAKKEGVGGEVVARLTENKNALLFNGKWFSDLRTP